MEELGANVNESQNSGNESWIFCELLNRESSDEAGNPGISIRSKHWAIVQGWIPPIGDETVSLLNVSGQEAHVEITVYYSHRDPAGPYCITIPEGRTEHVHLNCLTDPELIPRKTNYAEYHRIGRTNRSPACESIENSPLQR